jgi:hypothetical protein
MGPAAGDRRGGSIRDLVISRARCAAEASGDPDRVADGVDADNRGMRVRSHARTAPRRHRTRFGGGAYQSQPQQGGAGWRGGGRRPGDPRVDLAVGARGRGRRLADAGRLATHLVDRLRRRRGRTCDRIIVRHRSGRDRRTRRLADPTGARA